MLIYHIEREGTETDIDIDPIDSVSLGVLTNTVATNRGVPEATESWKRRGRILPQSLWRERKPADTVISARRN